MRIQPTRSLVCFLISLGVLFGGPADAPAQNDPPLLEVDPLDWPNWRGPEQNGVSREVGIVNTFEFNEGPDSNLLWKSEALAGRSTPIVMHGKLYTINRYMPGTPSEGEQVVCVDAATGEILWTHHFNVYLSDVPDTRVGWSCAVGDPTTGRVYALGVCGYFVCLEGATGEVVWSRSCVEEYGMITTYGGRTNIPIVFEDLAIISGVLVSWGDTPEWGWGDTPPWANMAKPAHRFLAFDKATGELQWLAGTRLIPYDTTYSTPILSVLDGVSAMVFGSGDGAVWARQARTGRPIWSFPLSRRGLYTTPTVVDGITYMGQAEENLVGTQMGTVVAIDSKGNELWRRNEVMVGRATPLVVGDQVLAVDTGAKMSMFNKTSGEQIGRETLGRAMFSSPVFADGKVYVFTNDGRGYVMRPSAAGVDRVHAMRLPLDDAESHGSPIVSHGRLYVPTSGALYCFGEEGQQPAAAPRPPAPEEEPLTDMTPAVVHVIPAETLLGPGQTQDYRVKLYNAKGQLLAVQPAGEFELVGPGSLDASGKYTAAADGGHTAARIVFKQGELSGMARVRVIPPLPWSFNFDDGEIPITWLGGRVRHEPRDLDGEKVIAKLDEIPTRPGEPTTKLGTRSVTFFGPTDLSNYTVQADVRGQDKAGKLGDIGLVNQRYILDLQGASQRLQVRSWSAVLRMAKSAPFAWQADTWYTMKISTTVEDGQAIVRGKIWPRGQQEPAEWQIEAVDPAPNLSGSPGLFGNTSDSEIYYDNIQVQPNEG